MASDGDKNKNASANEYANNAKYQSFLMLNYAINNFLMLFAAILKYIIRIWWKLGENKAKSMAHCIISINMKYLSFHLVLGRDIAISFISSICRYIISHIYSDERHGISPAVIITSNIIDFTLSRGFVFRTHGTWNSQSVQYHHRISHAAIYYKCSTNVSITILSLYISS